MKATDIMREEHRVIRRVLECMTAATEHAETGFALDVDSFRKMVDFFRGFVDRCHHGKEEAHFFPMARQRGVGCAPGDVDILLADHEEGRNHIRAIDESLSALEKGESDARARFYEHARGYVLLLADHIETEDNYLFTTADTMLSASDQQALLRAFEETEKKDMEAGAHERLHALANELCAEWMVPVPTAEESHPHRSHS